MRVVTINTYAGSLLVAAQMAGLEVSASLEDSKFGVDIQPMNFPGLTIFTNPDRWPTIDLSDHVVIAHPPCSAFSVQNNSASRKGTGSDAFACTVRVLDYAMRNSARVVLVESVIGALEGAREVHDEYAQKYGYSLYRFLVNSMSFGVPQWRPRFWATWVKTDSMSWPIYFRPNYVKLKDILHEARPVSDPSKGDMQALVPMAKQVEAWDRESVPQELRDQLMSGEKGFGLVNTLVSGSKDYDKWAPKGFRSKHIRLLNPEGYAPTLLLDSGWWLPSKRTLYFEEYLRIMGFPDDYKMPQRYHAKQFKMYLSKGVCPPVAAWFLEQAKYWWEEYGLIQPIPLFADHKRALPGEVLDLRPNKKEVPS